MKIVLCIAALVALLTIGLIAGTNQIVHGQATYLLGPGDKLSFYLSEDSLNHKQERVVLAVSRSGTILVPITLNLPQRECFAAQHKTLAELRAEIKRTFEQNYYDKATIELELLETRIEARKIVICGELESTMYLYQDRPLSLAVLLRILVPGQFTNLEAIEIYHQSMDGTVRSEKVNWVKMSRKHEDFPLHSGDIVHFTRGTWDWVAWQMAQKK